MTNYISFDFLDFPIFRGMGTKRELLFFKVCYKFFIRLNTAGHQYGRFIPISIWI